MMAEPPPKRPRRTEDDMDRSRDNRQDLRDRSPRGGRDYNRDSYRDRDRRERPRSRERGSERDRYGGRGARRDNPPPRERERERDRERDGGRGGRRDEGRDWDRDRDYRDSRRGREGGDRDKERDNDRKRPREGAEDRLSRSPRRDRNGESKRDEERKNELPAAAVRRDVEDVKMSRTSTPSVAFKVEAGKAHYADTSKREILFDRASPAESVDPEVMDTDGAELKKNRKTRKNQKAAKAQEEDEDDIVVEDDEMAAMQAMLGFGGFGTTHQKKVVGNDVSGIRKEKKTEYRQYMNRVGGFNRALSPTRDP